MFGCEERRRPRLTYPNAVLRVFHHHPWWWSGDLARGGGGGRHRVHRFRSSPEPGAKGRCSAARRSDPGTEFCVDIVVKGRKTEVPERFRKHVAEKLKLEKIQKLD